MKRLIFTAPIELTREAILFRDKIAQYNGVLSEKTLCTFLSSLFNEITPRDIRLIAERFNKRKFINADNNVKFHKTKGKYYKVIETDKKASKVLNMIKFNAIASLKTYKLYLEDWPNINNNENQIKMIENVLNEMEIE